MTWVERPCPWATARPDDYPPQFRYCTRWGGACEERGCERKKSAAARRKAELSAYRKFPGNDVQQRRRANILKAIADGTDVKIFQITGGHCVWCEGEIYRDDDASRLNTRRTWHMGRPGEPNCFREYNCHTRAEDQLKFLAERDGPVCQGCGKWCGRWVSDGQKDPDRLRGYSAAWARIYPAEIFSGPFTAVHISTALEVDHVVPLALVVLLIPEEHRWQYWGPMNLAGLCHDCHTGKTRDDVAAIKIARRLAAEA